MVTVPNRVDNTHPQNNSMEGGERVLNEKMDLAAKYGINIESLDFSIDDFTIEELTEKFKAIITANTVASNTGAVVPENAVDKFALTKNIIEELDHVLSEVKIKREWGEYSQYRYVDCDMETSEVYCWDTNDWLLYGFVYTVDGDSIKIDFETKKRKKYMIVDFDEGEQPSPFASVFAEIEQRLHDSMDLGAKYQAASDTIASMETELGELRQFKTTTEAAIAQGERDKVFAEFKDLVGVEAFETLRENCMKYDIETLEEKCYAIRGRSGIAAKFVLENKIPKLKVEKTDVSNEPYGGIFTKYGIGTEN